MTEWPTMTLRDAGVALIDCVHKTPPAVEVGYPYVTIPQMKNGRIDFAGARRITHADFIEWTKKARPQVHDVVLSRRTNPGVTATFGEICDFALGQNLVLLRANGSLVCPEFLRWLVVSPAWWSQIEKYNNVGAVFDSLKCADVPRFELPIPPKREQRAIASILGALDDKIDLNRRMNETLEAMARAIFKDWFLRRSHEFSRCPVSDLIAGGIMKIGDGYRAKNDEMGSPGLPFIRAGELNNGFDTQGADVLHERSVMAARDKLSQAGDVAFTSKGTIGRFARVTAQTPQFVYSPQVCFWRSSDPSRLRPAILYLWMVGNDLASQIDAAAGQTDMAPYVSLRDQRAMKMPVFDESQHAVADMVEPLLSLQDANLAETRTLTATRDLLLPKLLSGEIRVKDAEKIAEAAA